MATIGLSKPETLASKVQLEKDIVAVLSPALEETSKLKSLFTFLFNNSLNHLVHNIPAVLYLKGFLGKVKRDVAVLYHLFRDFIHLLNNINKPGPPLLHSIAVLNLLISLVFLKSCSSKITFLSQVFGSVST